MSWQKAAKRVRVPLGVAFGVVFLILARPTWISLSACLPFAAGGLWLRGYASGYLVKNKELATTGPYAHTRNPLYLGSVLLAAAHAIAGARWEIAVALAVLFTLVYSQTIVGEERYLRNKFPDYEAYVSAVPRLIPRLSPAKLGGTRGDFSRALYLKNREYEASLGAVAMYAALILKSVFIKAG